MGKRYALGYDVGTGGCKAVVATPEGGIVATDFEPYEVCFPREHCAEQAPLDWWNAVVVTTRRLLEKSGVDPGEVMGLAFASQMLGVLPVDDSGRPLCPGIIWMDSRARKQAARITRRLGGPRMLMNVVGVVPSGKDVMCKYRWIEEEDPEVWARTRYFLDVKGYLVWRATGEFETDQTAASVTGFMDKKTRGWSPLMARVLGAKGAFEKLPPVRRSADVAGGLTPEAAGELGLKAGTPVASGMGDAPAAMIGGGAMGHGESVVSIGTSGLLLVHTEKPVNLGKFGMASIAAADPAMWLLTAELITAGGCLKWFAENLATEEERRAAAGRPGGIYAELDRAVEKVEPGSEKLIFLPWMYGERAPVTDTSLRGGFINLSLSHTRGEMLRAVYEGVAMNFRWCFEAAAARNLPCRNVRAIGGGAMSDAWMQIFADVTGRVIEPVEGANEAGALGAALVVPLALGVYRDYGAVRESVKVRRTFRPDSSRAALYDGLFARFKQLEEKLAPVCRDLNV